MKEDIEVFLIEKGYSIATQETYRRILLDLISIPDLVRKTVKTHTLNGRCRTVSGGEKTGEGIVL